MSKKALVPLNALAISSDPTFPTLQSGDIYFNTSLNNLKIYTGSSWVTPVLTSSANTFTIKQAITANTSDPLLTLTQNGSGNILEMKNSSGEAVAYVDQLGNIEARNMEVLLLDDISNQFDGMTTRFDATYQGQGVTITNPFRLLLTVNGIIQMVNTPEYVWGSPMMRQGFFLDSEGFIQFSEIIPPGSVFEGRIFPGSTRSTQTRTYPFKAIDMMMGD